MIQHRKQLTKVENFEQSSTSNNDDQMIKSEYLSINLNDWQKQRVLARKDDIYYQATIQTTQSTLVSVQFENSTIETYDIGKLEHKYSLIEDAAPQLDQLKHGVIVLYRNNNK